MEPLARHERTEGEAFVQSIKNGVSNAHKCRVADTPNHREKNVGASAPASCPRFTMVIQTPERQATLHNTHEVFTMLSSRTTPMNSSRERGTPAVVVLITVEGMRRHAHMSPAPSAEHPRPSSVEDVER